VNSVRITYAELQKNLIINLMLHICVKWGVWNFSTRQKHWRMLLYSH